MVSLLFSEPLYLVSVKSIKSGYATVTESTSFMPLPPQRVFSVNFWFCSDLGTARIVQDITPHLSHIRTPDWRIYGDVEDNRRATGFESTTTKFLKQQRAFWTLRLSCLPLLNLEIGVSLSCGIILVLWRDRVTVDGVWIGNRIYWTLTERNYR
jgi:hypothetical protein